MKIEGDAPRGEVRTNVQFVEHVENTLGFVLDTSKYPVWKARTIEASKVKRKRAKDPGLYTMENLLLTVEWLRRRRQEVKSPAAVCWFVDEALKNARSASDVDDDMLAAAVQLAGERGLDEWVGRLTRARGEGRVEVLREFMERAT